MKKDIKIKIWGRIFILPAKIKYIAVVILAAAALIYGIYLRNGNTDAVTVVTPLPTETPSPEADVRPTPLPSIFVYVVGEVKKPGIYQLTSGCMISHAVEAAGGFTENADIESINMVEVLIENTMIKVPAEGDNSQVIISSGGNVSGVFHSSGKVNINTAGIEELCTLSGVGESTAKKIISYREANGPFSSVEDIMNVPSIKEAKFMAIKDDICVE